MDYILPIPVIYKEEKYNEVTLRAVTAGILADTQKILELGDSYKALSCFGAGVIEKINETEDRAIIKNIVNVMPYKSLEKVIIKALLQSDKDDGVEGYYECPRCGTPKISEYNSEEILDTRDHVNELTEKITDNIGFEYTLSKPVEVKNGEETIEIINTIEFLYPLASHCSAALNKVGLKDSVRMQLQILIEAIVKINGKETEKSWKSNYGSYVFERLEKSDILQINKKINEYGINPAVKKNCLKCGKEFEVNINTSNFFVSALQS